MSSVESQRKMSNPKKYNFFWVHILTYTKEYEMYDGRDGPKYWEEAVQTLMYQTICVNRTGC